MESKRYQINSGISSQFRVLAKVLNGYVLCFTYNHWVRNAGYDPCDTSTCNLDEAHRVSYAGNITHTEPGVRFTSCI